MILHSLRSSQRPVMMATTPACLRPPPDPPPSTCMYAPLKALWPVIPPEPPDPPDGPLLLILQTVLSSVVSPSSLAAVVHLTLLLGAALLCTNETTGSTQPELWLARSVRFCIYEAPTPLHAASDPLIYAENTFCYASALSISASQFAVCSNYPNLRSKHFTASSWVISVKLLRFQYGNIGSRSLCLISTIAFFSTSVEHIQVVAKHLGTQRLCWIFISKFRHLMSFLLSNSFEIHIVSLGSFFGGSECRGEVF
ncbi:BnaC03g34560D [Brassica napus]|uniref:BnaC03g34560D protein n=1 Tax=Brassica napus TaxID=3708 RepID=A0A078F4S9_BRANA|nr:BnaC03g34560D [Brassica napus]